MAAQQLTKFYFGGTYEVDLTKYLQVANLETQVNSLGYAKTSTVDNKYNYLTTLITQSGAATVINGSGSSSGVNVVASTFTVNGKTVATTDQIPVVDQTYNAASSNPQSGKAVAQAVAAAGHIQYEVVDSLPATGQANTIYLIPANNPAEQNEKVEFMWIDGKWEQIGTTATDLTGYVTTTQLTNTLQPYAKTADVTTAINNAVTPVQTAVAEKLHRVDLTQSQWNNLGTYDETAVYVVTDVLA